MKRAVWRHVRSEQVHISTPEEYAQVAKERCPNIRIEYVPRESIQLVASFLEAKLDNVITVPGTHQMFRLMGLTR